MVRIALLDLIEDAATDRLDVPCLDKTDLFFSTVDADVEQAKALCETCPNRLSCLEDALDRWEEHGTWGGTSETQRRWLFQQQRDRDTRPGAA